MTFLIGGANSDSGAYQIDNSLRFNKGDSPKLILLKELLQVEEHGHIQLGLKEVT